MDIEYIQAQVKRALHEDMGSGDISAELVDPQSGCRAELICREHAMVCGQRWFELAFLLLDAQTRIEWYCAEGAWVAAGEKIAHVRGNAAAMLSAERTALNFLQTLSGTATTTAHFQRLLAPYHCSLLDTRKTLPLLRKEQKYATRTGGARNHRMGLYDAFLIKENHILACGGISAAVHKAALNHPDKTVEVEVENLDQMEQALEAGAQMILLDNFRIHELKTAVKINNGRAKLEASGNIDENNLAQVAETGVDYISMGVLTKHLKAIDYSLRFTMEDLNHG